MSSGKWEVGNDEINSLLIAYAIAYAMTYTNIKFLFNCQKLK